MLGCLYNLATDKYRGFFPAVLKSLLFILSLIYGAVVRILIFFSRLFSRKLTVNVISVGNITLGGTGKTALVEYICRFLKTQGKRIVVLTRGYARKPEDLGDEPYMLSKKLCDVPVIVDADRARGAKRAVASLGADTVILDDGFQQWKIKKDLEIVAIDATNPFGNRNMIPRGVLREPLSSLKRADVFVLTKVNLSKDAEAISAFLAGLNPRALIAESIHKPQGFYNLFDPNESSDICSLEGKTVTLFSGIGDPASFENLIKILGLKIGLSFRYLDHYDYKEEDFKRIIRDSRDKGIDTIVTTEKDAARIRDKLFPKIDIRFLVLRVALVITKGQEKFRDRLLKLYPV